MLVSTRLLFILCAFFAESHGMTDNHTVRVLYIGGDSTTEAMDRAQQYINDGSILPSGYRLQIINGDSKMCNRKQALDIFYSSLFNETEIFHAVIAGVCPLDTEILAAVTQYYYLTLISFTSSAGPDEGELYPYHFHTVPALSSLSRGIAEFLNFHGFGWQRVVIITQDQDSFKKTTELLTITLADRNFTIQKNILLSEGLVSITEDMLFVPDSRIYVLNMNSTLAKIVFCQALGAGLQQYSYVWIIPGTYEDDWLTKNITQTKFDYECLHNISEIEELVHKQRVIAINHYPHAKTTDGSMEGKSTADDVDCLAYDSVLTIAESLRDVSTRLGHDISDFDPLEVSDLVGREIGESIRSSVKNVSFDGCSGQIKFEDQSRVVSVIRILQYRNESVGSSPDSVGVINLAAVDTTESLLFLEGESLMKLWPGGVPTDGEPITEINYPLLPVVIISYIYAGAVIVSALLCLVSTLIFRKRKLIRLTSPNLNYIIGIGVIVFSSSVFLFVYPPLPFNVLIFHCGIRSWFAAIGYSLCFGTINTKMWRVYYIFHDIKPTSNKKAIKDWHLILVVSMFVMVDVIILMVATPLSSTRLKPEVVPDKEFGSTVNEDGITVNYEVILCESRYKTLWLVILFGYKVVVQIIGVFLAYKIRKVKIKVLNDSKEVAITLYITSIILAAVILITVVFDDYQNVYSATYSLGIPLASSVVLGVVYVSKMVRLYKDPKGDTIFTHVTNDVTGAAAGTGFATCDDHDRIVNLEKRVKELQAQLTACEGNEILPNSDMFTSFVDEKHKTELPAQASGRKKQVRIECHNDAENTLQHAVSLS